MNAYEKAIFRDGFMTALALADGYGRELEKRGVLDFRDFLLAHVVMAEKCFDDIVAKAVDSAENSEDVLQATRDVIAEHWK